MSDQMSNAPMMQGAPTSFFQTWINALTKPNERTYAEMAASPQAKAMTAYLWVFIGFLVELVLVFLFQGSTMQSMMEQRGYGDQLPGGGIGFTLISALCGGPVFAVIATIFFAIGVAIIQWVAKMFGGKGTFDQAAYCLAAIAAPYAIAAGLFSALSAIPFVGFCFRLILGLAGFYILFLQITAVKGVNQFGWGQAAGSVLLPGLVIFLVCCCLTVAISAATGAAIGNIFSSINQSLIP